MAGDTRTYVRMDDGMPDNPKIVGIPGGLQQALAGWLHFSAICYGSKQKTDGLLPVGMVGRLTTIPDPEAIASLLLEANLWHAPGHHCRTCVQPPPHHYVIHDYLEHQRSRGEIEALSEKRSAAGRKGGRASGETRKGQANTKHLLQGGLKQNEADAVTDAETEETHRTSSPPAAPDDLKPDPGTAVKAPKDAADRPDVEALCTRLAELMVANGCKPPAITVAWRTAARLLLDKDGRELDKALALLEWCQANEFWRTNVLSMPTFRRQYEQLRLKAVAEWERTRAGATVLPFRRTADDTGSDAHMERYLARVAAAKAASGETP